MYHLNQISKMEVTIYTIVFIQSVLKYYLPP